jgi:hypothetical protein
MLGSGFVKEKVEGKEFIFQPAAVPDLKGKQTTFLMPDFDEYGISYKDRSLYHHPKWNSTGMFSIGDYMHAIVVDGYFGGNWTRKMTGNKPDPEVNPISKLTAAQKKKVGQALTAFKRFYSK